MPADHRGHVQLVHEQRAACDCGQIAVGSAQADRVGRAVEVDITHVLLTLDSTRGCAEVEELGTDYDAAQQAYERAERQAWGCFDLDVVLLSADSLQTVKRTHSSYFDSKSLDELLAA